MDGMLGKHAVTGNKWVTVPKCRQIVDIDIDYWHAEHASKQVLSWSHRTGLTLELIKDYITSPSLRARNALSFFMFLHSDPFAIRSSLNKLTEQLTRFVLVALFITIILNRFL